MMRRIETVEQLNELYGSAGEASIIKEVPKLIPHYRAFIEASPFCTLATIGDNRDGGLMDCSPRGDLPGFVKIQDEQNLLMPDRRGNNRVDSLRNIIADPRVALCFLIPGSNSCLRVNGEGFLSNDPELLKRFTVKEQMPRCVIVIKTKSIYFQCGRAIIRSKLWDKNSKVDPKKLPSAGDVLEYLSNHKIDGKKYDAGWQTRAEDTLW